jgi:hypothetical protein
MAHMTRANINPPYAQVEQDFVRPNAEQHHSRGVLMAATAAIMLGILVRCIPVLTHDFPLNDGGMFYRMVEELQRSHYVLPKYTSYNQAHIPFAYSPFGFYAAGLLADLTSISLINVFRFLPLFVSILTVIAFFVLARSVLSTRASPSAVIAAVLGFALIPRTFVWMISGGGITRAFGFLFAIFALHQAYHLYTRQDYRYAVSTAILCALSVLSHIGTARFVAISIALLWMAFGRHRRGVVGSLVVASGTILLTAPWWGTVMAYHGVAPFVAANQTSGSLLNDIETVKEIVGHLARFGTALTSEPFFPLIGVLAFFGGLASLTPTRLFLPVWLVLLICLDLRGAATFSAVPSAMLVGICVSDILLPLLNRAWAEWKPTPLHKRMTSGLDVTNVVAIAVLGVFLLYTVSGTLTRKFGWEVRYLVSLSPEERSAMQWVRHHTPEDGQFLVYAYDDYGHFADRTAEWFPVLAERRSIITIQGYEWLPNFADKIAQYKQANTCKTSTTACLDTWSQKWNAHFTHVFIALGPSTPCCEPLLASLKADPRYELAYETSAAVVFTRKTASS